jgi:putative membrane protein
MLYLLQFFVYCAEAKSGSELSETLKAMERRPLKGIVSPAMIAVWLTGVLLAYRLDYFRSPWLQAKQALVLALSGIHGYLASFVRASVKGGNRQSALFYRILNETPTVLTIGIVMWRLSRSTLAPNAQARDRRQIRRSPSRGRSRRLGAPPHERHLPRPQRHAIEPSNRDPRDRTLSAKPMPRRARPLRRAATESHFRQRATSAARGLVARIPYQPFLRRAAAFSLRRRSSSISLGRGQRSERCHTLAPASAPADVADVLSARAWIPRILCGRTKPAGPRRSGSGRNNVR